MKRYSQNEVIEMLKKVQGERSLREFATALNISAAYLSDVYRSRRLPGPVLLRVLGMIRHTVTTTTFQRKRA